MDAKKIKELKFAGSSFESFIGLRSFLVMGDLVFHLMTLFYKNFQENILDPILDPYIPKNFLLVRVSEKITINLGKFLVETVKIMCLAYLTFQFFIFTEPYFKKYLKG